MNKKGFTLIELLAVVTLLAILVVFATSSGFGMFNKTKKEINASQIKSINEGFKIFLTELEEDNCIDYPGNPVFNDIKVIFDDTSAVINNCADARKYIGNKLQTLGGSEETKTITVELENFLKSGYVVGDSLDDVKDTGDITLVISGKTKAIVDNFGNPTGNYTIDGSLDHELDYEEFTGENDANNVIVYVDPISGNNSNNGKESSEPLKTIQEAINKYKKKNKKIRIKLLNDCTINSSLTYDKDLEISGSGARRKITFNTSSINISGDLSFSNVELKNVSSTTLEKAATNTKNTTATFNFDYTGNFVEFKFVKGIYVLEVWGAQGGNYYPFSGGKGGYSIGTLKIETPIKGYVYVGGQPTTVVTNSVYVPGGFNGGGNGFNRNNSTIYTYGQGGGGGTDIRIDVNNDNNGTLYERVIVAGGGSGANNRIDGFYAGGRDGQTGQLGYGASQTSEGRNGSFGRGASAPTSGYAYAYGAAGGGGGWYGGGSYQSYSQTNNLDNYTGGGSGYVYTSSTASNYRTGGLLNETYFLTNAQMRGGNEEFLNPFGSNEVGHSGNGYARITLTIN